MAYPVTLNGRTYTLADFAGTNYVDGFPDALEDFVTQAGNIYTTTSTSSVAIGSGSKTFTVADSGKPYIVGTPLRIADSAAPSTNWIDGIVTSYSGTTLVVDAVAYAGSGTKTAWNINLGGGPIAYTGTLPIAQGGTGGTTAAAARTNLDVYSKGEADSRFLNVSGEASDVTITGTLTAGTVTADGLTVLSSDAALSASIGTTAQRVYITPNGTEINYNASGNSAGSHMFQTGNIDRLNIASNGDISFYEDTGTTPKFFWDASAEALGIGTSLPSQKLHLVDSDPKIQLTRTSDFYYGQLSADGFSAFTNTNGSAPVIFKTGTSERMRIDASGNLLVGMSTASATADGFYFDQSGFMAVSRSRPTANTSLVAQFNRKTTDGDIVQFHKDGTTVGSIGVAYSRPYLASINCGISPHNTANYVAATNSTGTTVDNTVDLGASGYRWKDLYLSGGVYLGGTGAANYLDDYETGQFNADIYDDSGQITTHTGQARYIKIGQLCHIDIEIYSNGVSSITVNTRAWINLPFAGLAGTNGIFLPHYYNGVGSINSGYINGTVQRLYLTNNRDEPFGNNVGGTTIGGTMRLYGNIVYRTA